MGGVSLSNDKKSLLRWGQNLPISLSDKGKIFDLILWEILRDSCIEIYVTIEKNIFEGLCEEKIWLQRLK